MSTPSKQLDDFSSGDESVNDNKHSPSTSSRSLRAGSTASSETDSSHSKDSPVTSASKSLGELESQLSTLGRPSARTIRSLEELANFDVRPKLPACISRFLGYRKDGICRPIWMLQWLDTFHVPLVVEEYFFACFCTNFGLISVIAINTMTPFSSLPIPISLGFVGALSIILYLTPHSPAAAPRNVFLSHLFASMIATVIAKLFLSDAHKTILIAGQMTTQTVWVWACVAVTSTLIFQKIFGLVHPPAGGTALIGTIQPAFIRIGWRYVGFVMSSVLCMLGVALLWGNVGRRAYPDFWFIQPTSPPSNAFQTNPKDSDSVESCSSSRRMSEVSYQSCEDSKDNLTTSSRFNQDISSEKSLSLSIRAS
ncbi:hypothetical protein PGT21_031860 [Puccinia graminis f. sp. tritici]|uniref:HPP transmembrane region domain-containing protein n=2 Tax=Puccinia graminis f. sp. tritici TaxID=56615 RepID=E3K5D2_PUCGT|nr:uncharacterized protein PGTG_06049 [Puccinia graminis f. sp. tritici CRL 75-36-700-3]EFP79728.2 hypothetical protein PGTG_06049 [Puccinia graminis f. sp. tritici CRL 75-36-700-3]KAA1119687.1 hypothetical protein PGT21_031860 [Puccinia graminis f. sp. tritici]